MIAPFKISYYWICRICRILLVLRFSRNFARVRLLQGSRVNSAVSYDMKAVNDMKILKFYINPDVQSHLDYCSPTSVFDCEKLSFPLFDRVQRKFVKYNCALLARSPVCECRVGTTKCVPFSAKLFFTKSCMAE